MDILVGEKLGSFLICYALRIKNKWETTAMSERKRPELIFCHPSIQWKKTIEKNINRDKDRRAESTMGSLLIVAVRNRSSIEERTNQFWLQK